MLAMLSSREEKSPKAERGNIDDVPHYGSDMK